MKALHQSLLGLRLVSRYVASYRNTNLTYAVTKITQKYPNKHYQPTIAFGISTIVLGVENSDLRSQIDDLESNATTTTTTPETTTSAPTTPAAPEDMSKYRLPTTVKPILYNLYLYPDLQTGLFRGKVIVSVEVLSETNSISLHSNLLTIDTVRINSVTGNFALEQNYELLTITKPDSSNFAVGDATVEIDFNGDMKDRIVGLYTSSYTSNTGETRQIATSKFEPTYARQAFPCFDEPNMKSRYIVHLLKPKDDRYIALSNYPVSHTEDYDSNNQLVTFHETVSMSTYLSCFIVSDFTSTETSFVNKDTTVPLKVYASPDNLIKTTYAGEVGKKIIEYYVQYFNIAYPLPKLDMVAIPDFVSGAMEHWGLVTYRETALLYTEATHSTSNKQRVASVIAHELAHSWFGNLVTMDWWNDLWLNEGFASYIEYKGVLAAEPTWGMLEQFLTSDLHPVLSLDATLSSHPIVQTVVTPDQITEIFDTISYNKGASILRMLEATVGEANFQTGVTNYLNKYAFSNAITENFLTEIQNAVGSTLDIAEMMDTYTVQMGYPILTLSVTESDNGNTYTFTQKRFLKDPGATFNASESPYGYKWTIPLTYITDSGVPSSVNLFRYNVDQFNLIIPPGSAWIKFNYDQLGYYRVNYPEAQWKQLGDNFGALTVSDKTHLLEEAFSIAEAGQLSYEIPLELTRNLVTETNYSPWRVASSKFQSILRYLSGSGSVQEATFKSYIGSIVTPAYESLTWSESEGDAHLRRLTRIDILSLACTVDHEGCLSEAQSRFNEWIQNKTPLSQDLRSLIYRFGMRNADVNTWEQLLDVYKAETDASEKLKLVNGLANVQDVTLLNRLIELSRNESIVRGQDFFTVIGYISGNTAGTSLVWDWVRENWEYLVDRFTLNDRYLGSLIPTVTNSFATQERLTEMQQFFAKYPNAGAGTANRATALETVQNNIRWLASHKGIVEDWIDSATKTTR